MTHELGIQIRDLRLLDPLMTSTYPSAILCRDKALVVNLECELSPPFLHPALPMSTVANALKSR